MNSKVKLLLYVVLGICLASFGAGLYATYHSVEPVAVPVEPATNAPVVTNMPSATTNAALTNLSPSVEAASAPPAAGEATTARKSSPRLGRMMAYLMGMFFTLVGLAVMIGYDVSRFLSNRVDAFIFNDNLEGVKDPEYEEAEHIWATGEHLEAVRLMREYLRRHPREQYVALRIAEIYETDLGNYLAAALEYEEILKKKLPTERWGWAAIHLANLYSGKLNKPEQATALLRRIVEDYGQTAAAKKARSRLGLPEPVEEVESMEPEPEPETAPKQEEPPPSNLPKGFRPK